MSKGGGGPPPTQQVETTTSRIPDFAEPYYREMMGRAAYETTRPYEAYPGQRLADFTAAERAGQAGMAEMASAGAPPEMGMASDIASQVGYGPTMSAMQVAQGFQPQQVRSGYRAADIDPGYQAGQLGQGYQAGQRQAGYGGPGQFGPGFDAGTVADPETLQSYMNPYQRMVTDIEKREAQRQSDIQAAGASQQAAQAGGLGGYREAIMQAERERNLGQQMGDIETRGGQAAFQQAQQAFEADRAARLQAGQLGLQTGEARERALQAGETFGQQQFATNEQLRQQQQQADLSAYQAGEAARPQAGSMGMTAQEIEDRGRQAENQARMSAQQFNVEQGYRQAQLGMGALTEDRAAREQRLGAASQLGQLGGQQQRMAYERLRNLQAMGQGQREMGQRSLDMGYQDYLRQQRFPREQLSYLSNLIQGLPLAPMYNQATAVQGGPGGLQQAIGGLGGAVGLYRGMPASGGGRVPGLAGVGLNRALRGS